MILREKKSCFGGYFYSFAGLRALAFAWFGPARCQRQPLDLACGRGSRRYLFSPLYAFGLSASRLGHLFYRFPVPDYSGRNGISRVWVWASLCHGEGSGLPGTRGWQLQHQQHQEDHPPSHRDHGVAADRARGELEPITGRVGRRPQRGETRRADPPTPPAPSARRPGRRWP